MATYVSIDNDMAQGLFEDVKEAFGPFFDDEVEYEAADGVRTMLACCLFPIDDAALMLETNMQTDMKCINVLLCNFCKTVKPKVGEHLRTTDGRKYAIASVDLENTWTKIFAREVKA